MKWMLVAIVWGTTPIPTGLVYNTLPECIAAEAQARKAWVDAFNSTPQEVLKNPKSLDLITHQMISGTCIPHP